MQILPISKEQNKNIFFLLLTFIISLSLVLISFIGSTTYAAVPTVTDIEIDNTNTIQNAVFGINVTFSEEVNGVDIGDFRFVDSSTSAEKGIIINVAEYDSTFANAITDSSTTDTTSLIGQYFKVTVASDFGIISTDTNNFEVFADSTDPIISISTSEPYTTTNTIAVKVEDSTARPIVTDIEIDNTNTIQNAVFGINITFIEEVSGVDIADFRFVESSTDTEKGSIINVAEYTDGNFDTPITDSSTTDTTSLTGQYFKVTVASDFGIESADSNSFEILVDSTDPIRSTATYFSYITTTDTIAVKVEDSTARPTVSLALPSTGTQEASFGVNIAFSEVVSGVDIVDFRFVESGTDTKKGHIVNVAEYDDSGFLNATTDSSTINSITTLTGQYFKVTVAADSNLLQADSNSFEVVVDTDTPIRSTATYFPYTTTNTLAVAVDSTASTPIISLDGTDINSGSTIYTNQDEISLTASSLETDSILRTTKGYYSSDRVGSSIKQVIQLGKNTFRFAGNLQNQNVYGTGNDDSYIKLNASNGNSSIRSIAFWADPDDDIDVPVQRIFNLANKYNQTSEYDNSIYRYTDTDNNTNGIVFSTRSGNTDTYKKTFTYAPSSYSYFDRHHYVFVYSSSGWNLYIDGASVTHTTGSLPTTRPAADRTYNYSFFGKLGHSSNYYTGDLQNIIISKNVLGADAAKKLYNDGVVRDNVPEEVLNANLWYAAGISTTPETTLVEDTTESSNTADFKLISVSSDPADPAIVTNINPNDDTNIFVTQIDAFGNESSPSRIVVIHDNIDPSVPTLTFIAENIPGDNVITVSGAESDATVTVTATHNTELDINNNPLQVINTRTGNGDVILNLTTLGDWNITAFQTDLAENDSASSVSATLKISILAPKLIVNPSYATEIITIEVSDVVSSAIATVTATHTTETDTNGDLLKVEKTIEGNGNITLELSFGRWTLKVKQSSSGVDSPDSEEYSILLDEHAPTISTTVLDTTGTKSTGFDVKVAFDEDVKNVDISDFVLHDSSDNVKGKIIKVTAYIEDTFATESASTIGLDSISGQYFKILVHPNINEQETFTFKVIEDANTDNAISDLVGQLVDRSVGTFEIPVAVDTTVPATPRLTFDGVEYVSGATIRTNQSKISLNVSSLESNAQTINIGRTGHLPSNKIEGTLNGTTKPDDTTFRFDGLDDYIGFPEYNFGPLAEGDPVLRSISFWADPDDSIGTNNQRIINLADGSNANTNTDISIYRNGYGNGITLALERYITGDGLENHTATYTSDSFSYFDRNHYVVIFSGGGWELYVNGVAATLSNIHTATPNNATYNSNFIGRFSAPDTNSDKEYYGGDIQNIIFSEKHFDSNDIVDLYNGGYIRDNIPAGVSGNDLIYAGAIGLLLEDAPTVTSVAVTNAGAQDSGDFSININATNHIFVTQTNALGITSEPIHIEVINITVALDPLTISATDTSNTSIGNHTITVSDAETDSEVTVTATHNTKTDTNGDPLQVTSTRTGNGDITIALPESGEWSVSAVQSDQFGNISNPTTITITLDSNAPKISVATLTGTTVSDTNAVVVTLTDGFIEGETITVTATPADTTQTTQTGTIDTSTTSRDVTLTLVDGVWSISAVQTISGETNPSDTSASKVITVDTTDPDFTITIPNTDLAQSKDVTITANGTDDDTVTYSAVLTTDSDNATCAATNDSVFSDPSTGITATGNIFTLTLESDNDNYICVKATDQANNTTKKISTSKVDGIDTTDPDFTIGISPTTPSQSKTVTFTLTNTEPSTVGYSYFFTTDSDKANCENADDSSFNLDTPTSTPNTFTLTLESDNPNYICAKATDEAGNTAKAISLQIANIDTTDPEFTIDLPPTTPSQSKTVAFTLTKTEVSVAYSYFLTKDETEKTNCPTAADTSFQDTETATPTQLTLNLESYNDAYICVRAEDAAGNITKKLSANAINGIDTTDPDFTIGISPTTPSQSKTVAFTLTTTEVSVAYSYFLATNETEKTNCPTATDTSFQDTDPTTPTQFTLTLESDNGSYVCVRAEDAAGNITKKTSLQIANIDTTEPEFTIDIPPTTPSQSKTVTLTNTNSEPSTVTYSAYLTTDSNIDCANLDDINFSLDPTTNTDKDATFTLTLESDNGNYICVRAEDEANNTTKKISTSKVDGIDTTAPTISGTQRDGDYQITITTNEDLQTVALTSVTSGGGFTFTNDDGSTTLTPTQIEIAANKIILTFDSSGTALTATGTYIYTKPTTAIIKNVAGVDLESFDSVGEEKAFTSFSIDIDGSKSFTAASDAFFLYLYTQNQDGGVDITDGVLGQSIFGGVNNVLATKARVQDGIDGGYLDFDGSKSFTAASDAFFLYLYRQNQDGGVDITDGVLGQSIFGGVNNVLATKGRIDALIASIPTE